MTIKRYDNIYKAKDTQTVENDIKRYNKFHNWIFNDPAQIQKQKELINAFSYAYDFIDDKRKKLASHKYKSTEQYIKDSFHFFHNKEYQKSHTYDPSWYGRNKNDLTNYINIYFLSIIMKSISRTNEHATNEEIFQVMKKELKNKESYTYQNSLSLWKD
ncbi:hypothetical protein [Borrelia duttonii]|uniref:hypothetical protein n=1 Tax=Borrelia duttonii TaxID=40834 RepID=UPI00030B0F2B